jgi:hypothetical protein
LAGTKGGEEMINPVSTVSAIHSVKRGREPNGKTIKKCFEVSPEINDWFMDLCRIEGKTNSPETQAKTFALLVQREHYNIFVIGGKKK